MSTRQQVDAAIPVFLAALREAGYPVADSYAWAQPCSEGWQMAFPDDDVPDEVAHRAVTIARASVGLPMSCFWCWVNVSSRHEAGPCSLGDCRAPSEATR